MAQNPKRKASPPAKPAPRRRVAQSLFDAIVVSGGPAGSTLAWKLASQGATTLILDAAKFPREKLCGDYVEPRGLRILDRWAVSELWRLRLHCPLPTRRLTSTASRTT